MSQRQARVLYVEDQELDAAPIIRTLSPLMEEFRWVKSARELRATAPDYAPTLLILDATLETDGLEYFQAIRFSPQHPDLGVIVLTDRGDRVTRERAQQLGAAAVLSKPCTPEEVLATIDRLIEIGAN